MTIAPLPTPYNGETHVRLVNINLDAKPSVAHFRLGHFDGEVPAMPYSADDAPAGWVERAEYNTAELPVGIVTLGQVVEAISAELQAHA